MPTCFGGGSSKSGPSYMPGQENLNKVEGITYGGTMPGEYFQPSKKYFYDGQEISRGDYEKKWSDFPMLRSKMSTQEGASPFQSSRPQFNYQPGESGYNLLGQQPPTAGTAYQRQGSMQPQGQNNIWQDKPVDANFQNQAEPYYNQLEQNATNNAMLGARSAANSMASALGQRGVAQGGLGQMAGNQLASSLGRQLGDISSNIGFQRAQDYNQLAQSGAELQQRINEFNRQLDLQEQMSGRQMSLAERQQLVSEMINQYNIDKGFRAEQYGYWKDPFNDYMNLQQMGMSLPATSQGQQNANLFPGGIPAFTGYLAGGLA
jgi:hypothetical protein